MKSIDELDHYELLEIPPTAGPGEIDRAYRLAAQTYAEGSLALYSVFETMDASAIRSRIDVAYQTLADPDRRKDYDREIRVEGSSEQATPDSNSTAERVERIESEVAAAHAQVEESGFDAFDEVVEEYDALEEDGSGDYDGVRLRRTRLFRGYEIEDISDVTKVSGNHLRNIEEENFADLPADVYVRGFVTAYAKTIGLDPAIVVPAYMARLQESRQGGRRGGFLARH